MSWPDQGYRSYLLRLWLATSGDKLVVRASLESAQTGHRVGFACLDQLFDFLRGQTGAGQDTSKARDVGQK